jgi:hypothetical protein
MSLLSRAVLLTSLLSTVLAAGCQSAATPESASPVAPDSTQVAETRPTPSRPAPTPTFPPEVVASQAADIAGVWRLTYKGASATFPANLTLREDSTFLIENAQDQASLSSGTLRFADGKVVLVSEAWFDVSVGTFASEMEFIIYASLVGGRPVRIRFDAAEEIVDPREKRFIDNFDGRVLMPAPS